MLHQVIPSILLILAYVAAAAAKSDEVCAEFVDLNVSPSIATDAFKKFTGLYQVTDEKKDDKPVYRNEDDTNVCMFTASSAVFLGDCHLKAMEYHLLSALDTCFQPSMTNDASPVIKSGIEIRDVVEMSSVVRGADCSECREILAGDLKGNYTLIDKHSPHCPDDTDMCVYANMNDANTVCFKKDAAGQDTMPHDETCG